MDEASHNEYKQRFPIKFTLLALHDSWLQIKSKPGLYISIWATLMLVPYLIMGRLLSGPISESMVKFLEYLKVYSATNGSTPQFSPDFIESIKLLLLWTGIFNFFSLIFIIFYASVLFTTVRLFYQHTIPHLSSSLAGGVAYFRSFFKIVFMTFGTVIWKPASVFICCMLLGSIAFQSFFLSLGIIAGMVIFLPGFYRYGLVPFIYMSTDLPFEGCTVLSRHFYNRSRLYLTTLFFWLIFVPIFVSIMLTAIFIRMGLYTGLGSMVLWISQSAMMFISIMALSNFTMSFFSGIDDDDAGKKDADKEDGKPIGSNETAGENDTSEKMDTTVENEVEVENEVGRND